MKFLGILAFGFFLGTLGLVAADKPAETYPNIVDETGDIGGNKQFMDELQANLGEFELETGAKLFVQLHLKAPAPTADKNSSDYMKALSTRLGLNKKGVVLVHFSDSPDWRLWIGDDLVSRFVGKPGTAQELTDSGALKEAREALLSAAVNEANKALAFMTAAAGSKGAPAWMAIRAQVASLQDALRAKLVTD